MFSLDAVLTRLLVVTLDFTLATRPAGSTWRKVSRMV